ncbi:unnamed protein product, partial [marine sediment metagenome]
MKIEHDTLAYLEKVGNLIKSNLDMYRSAFQDDTKIVPMIEEKYGNLIGILKDLEKKYSKRILKFLLVINNLSGLTMFQHAFAKGVIDSDLISGFLTAIQSFGMELSTEGSSEMTKLAYKNFEIELNVGDHIRAALFLSGEASKFLVRNLVTFINDFERTYGDAYNSGPIFATDLVDYRLQKATENGASYAINPKEEDLEDFIMDKTDNHGVHVIINTVGNSNVYQQGLELIAKGGHYLFFAETY